MDPFDLEFVEWSLVCDDPKLLEQVKNRYYDPEFDEWEKEFDKEQEQLQQQHSSQQLQTQQNPPQQNSTSPVELPDAETIEWSNQKPPTTELPTEKYEMGDTSQFDGDEWERED